jgi:hypothetical protein
MELRSRVGGLNLTLLRSFVSLCHVPFGVVKLQAADPLRSGRGSKTVASGVYEGPFPALRRGVGSGSRITPLDWGLTAFRYESVQSCALVVGRLEAQDLDCPSTVLLDRLGAERRVVVERHAHFAVDREFCCHDIAWLEREHIPDIERDRC